MKLSPKTHQAYKRWITSDTWYKGESYDMKLFFGFVQAYLQFTRGNHITGSMLKDDILATYQDSFDQEHLQYCAIHYGNLFEELIAFQSYLKNPYK